MEVHFQKNKELSVMWFSVLFQRLSIPLLHSIYQIFIYRFHILGIPDTQKNFHL